MSDRFSFPRSELRRRTLRGVMVTSGFMIAIDGLVLIQGLVVTRLLGPSEIGLYGIVSTFVVSIVALKRVGIDEAFVQQEESDQEAEFQRAFTLELALGTIFTAIICALAPAVAAVYRDSRLLPLTLALAYLPLTFALQAPMWIFFRRMDYARQRSLQATQLLVGLIVTVPLAAATDLGVWSIVIGQVAGYMAAVVAGLAVSPYRLRLRDLRDPGSSGGPGGAVRQVKPGDARLGAAVLGRRGPVRAGPRVARARRSLAAGRRVVAGAGRGGRDPAVGVQLVLVLPCAR